MFKRLLVVFCLGALLLQTGCTSKFAYNNIDWMLYWYVDDYIDLDKSQKQRLDEKVEKWLAWHRQDELVIYRQHLIDLKADVQQGKLSPEQWISHMVRGSEHWQRFRNEISPELSELSVHLTDEQIVEMFEILEKNNQKKEKKRNKKTDEERWEDSIDNMQDQVQDWTGKLSDSQKTLIAEYVKQFKPTFEHWMAYRRATQAATKTLLLSRNQISDYQLKLNELIQNPDQFKSPVYLQASENNRTVYAELLANLLAGLTEKQKKHVLNELDDLIDDLNDLIED